MSTVSEQKSSLDVHSHPQVFFEMLDVPVFCNVLWSEKQAAQTCTRGDIKLAFNPQTGLISNIAFDPALLQYSPVYENALDFSPRFQEYAKSLALRLIQQYHLYEKDIVEIGCGKGDFLLLLCELGNNRGAGFDPSYLDRPIPESLSDRLQFVRDFYSEQYAHHPSDFIACRHTLEHIPDPAVFLKMVRRVVGDRLDTVIFFEVPNALDTFRHMAIWDIIYEHCCYFAPTSLSYFFSTCGFQVHHLSEDYQGQFLCLEATPAEQTGQGADAQHTEAIAQLKQDVETFAANFQTKVSNWREKLEQLVAQGKKAVVWGAGSKGVTFLNVLKPQSQIEYIVDINPRKHGMYVAGTGQKIVPPEFLRDYRPDVVFIMNSIYQEEIRRMINQLGFDAELLCV